jgi:3'-phosphoadenosine 5'-phosphosulfate sulfotransferase (PAPS reductase)/FAD synthetase
MNLIDLNGKIIGCPQSAGINSAGALCRLKEAGITPKELHIFYAHFEEHSPDSLRFVQELIKMAENSFPVVKSKITYNSVIQFFEEQKMIPHPIASPCSRLLKIVPLTEYNAENRIEIDLIGYVRTEQKRIDNQQKRAANDMFLSKMYPIADVDDEWCFDIVKRNLGWYPAIYDLKWNDAGFIPYVTANLHRFSEEIQRKIIKKVGTNKRVFKHNNCLPCKNMNIDDLLAVEYFYPEHMAKAVGLSERLNAYWGRNADQYYTTFGKEDYEVKACEVCQFD